jgi:ATP-dependent exoDNAse (exonuclease V) beta subunit
VELQVYKASAGSGKTFTLAVEYIKHLIRNPYAYRHILAVTFTNKATTEMKERILGQLYGIHTHDPQSEAYLNKLIDELQLPEDEIRMKAGKALSLMIHDYNHFRVETIDSFFQSVMRNLARELELGANLNIELDNTTALSEAVDSMIEKLDRHSPVLYQLLDYIEERIEDDKQWKVAHEIKEFGKNIFNEEYIEKGAQLRKALENPDCIPNYRRMLKALEKEAVEQLKGFGDQFFGILEEHEVDVTDLSYKESGVAGYFLKLQKGVTDDKIKGTRVIDCMNDAKKWTGKSHKRKDEIISLAERELIPLLKTAEEFRGKNNRIINSCQLSLRHVNNVQLLNHIDEEVRTLNQEKNRFLLADTNALLHNIVREGDPSFVFEKIGSNIRNVMIDEFQDTSRMQWDNFKLLLNEGLSQGADSLIVGDVKQSIYRWRNGDWTILNGLKGQLGPFPIEEKTLNTNRRSEAAIVQFNNEIFTSACQILNDMHKQEQGSECTELKNAYQDVRQETNRETVRGSVKFTFLTDKIDVSYQEETLQQLAEEVESMAQQGVSLNDMAILVRKNGVIPVVADYFDKHTPYRIVSDEAFRLDASLAINMLMDAIRYLVEPKNSIAQAQLAIAYQNEVLHKDMDLNTLLLANLDKYLPSAFIEELDTLRLMPLLELLEKLTRIFQLSLIENQDAYLLSFYDHVNDYLQKHSSELTAFVKHWEEKLCFKTIPSGNIEGIRILSIHKSKGLEFHTVFLPFCDWKLENERTSYIWCTPPEAPFDELQLLPINYGTNMNESIYQNDYRKEKLQLWVDNLNLLYVAFTRPQCNLVVWCKEKGSNTVSELLSSALVGTSCQTIESLDNCIYQLGEVCPSKTSSSKKVSTNKLVQTPESIPVKLESLDTPIEFKQSNRSADFIDGEDDMSGKYIRQGQVMHSLFSMIRTPNDVPGAIARLRMEGIIESDKHEQQTLKLVNWALKHPQVKEWFSGKWNLYNECAILYRENGELQTRRPDRVMMKDGEVIVVDFKFGKPYPEYNIQVKEYMDLLHGMGYEQVSGYLWYVFYNQLEKIE